MQAERGERRAEVDEHHHARGRGMREPGVDEDELAAEQQPGHHPGPEGAVARKQRHAPRLRPDQHQAGGNARADRRLHHQRDVRRGELDRDLLEAPQTGEQDHQRDRGRVERAARVDHVCGCGPARASRGACMTPDSTGGAAFARRDCPRARRPLGWRSLTMEERT